MEKIISTRTKKGTFEKPETFIKLNNIVLIAEDNEPRQVWKLGRVIKIHKSIDGAQRSVELKTKTGILRRSVQRLVPLEIPNEEESESASSIIQPPMAVGGEYVKTCTPPCSNNISNAQPGNSNTQPKSNSSTEVKSKRTIRKPERLKDYVP